MHFLLPCLCKSRFNFYFLFSFFLYYILPSIVVLLSLSPPLFPLFSSSFLHYLHNYFSPAAFNLHICLLLSCPILPLFTLLFTISSCLSTHTHTHTHTDTYKERNGLAGRFYKINHPLRYMNMDHYWHDYLR